LEHIPQAPLLALKEMQRVVKPGGHLLLTTPNIARSINRGKLAAGKSVMYPVDDLLENEGKGSTIYMRHNREYTMDELVRLVQEAGWNVTEQEYVVSYTPFRKRQKPDPLPLWLGKLANYLVMQAIPSLRDTLLVLGVK
jgi:2-polyprenyl-3-methyl-5-hydroxy-6-metoxy-1,4-benzoquinol methylase